MNQSKKTSELFQIPENMSSKFNHDIELIKRFDAQILALQDKTKQLSEQIKQVLEESPRARTLPLIMHYSGLIDILEQQITIIQQKHEMFMGISQKIVDKFTEHMTGAKQVDDALKEKESVGDTLDQMEMFKQEEPEEEVEEETNETSEETNEVKEHPEFEEDEEKMTPGLDRNPNPDGAL